MLFNFQRAKGAAKDSGLIVVEGFFATMKLHEAGLPNVVATMGAEVSPYQVKLLSGAKDLVVLFDGDDAGYAGAENLRMQIGATIPVRVVRLPRGEKPDHCSPKLLRWLVNGVRALDLVEVSFTQKIT